MSEYESYLSELSDRIQPFKRGNLFLTFVMRIQKLWNSFGSRCLFGADSVCRFGVLSAWSGMSRCLARLPTCPYVRVRTGHVRSTAPSHNGNEHRFGIIITFVMSDQNCTCPRTSRISRNVSNWMRCNCTTHLSEVLSFSRISTHRGTQTWKSVQKRTSASERFGLISLEVRSKRFGFNTILSAKFLMQG